MRGPDGLPAQSKGRGRVEIKLWQCYSAGYYQEGSEALAGAVQPASRAGIILSIILAQASMVRSQRRPACSTPQGSSESEESPTEKSRFDGERRSSVELASISLGGSA